MRRRGFTILEILIAAGIATVLTIVLFDTLISGNLLARKNFDILGYLRDASLLMEYIKTDIRNAPRGEQNLQGENPSLMRSVPDGPPQQVEYRFDKEQGIVQRTSKGAGGRTITFGRGQTKGKGTIVEFSVETVAVEGTDPFYRIVVGFASPQDDPKNPADPSSGPRTHRVQALVSQRTAAVRDDKWNTAFQM